MIEWDEVFEDINWTKTIVSLLLGVIAIAAVVVVLLDWHKYNTMKSMLEADKTNAQSFQATWSPPSAAELKELRAEKAELQDRLDRSGVQLPTSLDEEELETVLKGVANQNRVSIDRIMAESDFTDGYALVQPFEVTFKTDSLDFAKAFLTDIHRMPRPHKVISQPLSLRGTMEVKVEFYGFDQEEWDEVNACDMKSTMPDIPFRDIENIFIFGSKLTELKNEVDQLAAGLADTKKQFIEACELQTEVDLLRTKLEIINNLSK